jgi:hypothetical protein
MLHHNSILFASVAVMHFMPRFHQKLLKYAIMGRSCLFFNLFISDGYQELKLART